MKKLGFHAIANIFPLMTAGETATLAGDIKANGLRETITLLDGAILDGRNRWLACELAGVEPRTRNYDGDDPLAFVISANLHRRHLSESQRAMIAARLANMPQGNPTGSNQYGRKAANLPVSTYTQPEAAKLLSVSERSLRDAKVIMVEAPELAKQIDAGKATIHEVIKTIKKAETLARVRKDAALPDAKYRVLYADPPWKYAFEQHSKTEQKTVLENHYPTMSIEELCAMPVPSVVELDAVLFLWVTSPLLSQVWPLIEAWGFEYKASFVWDKVKHNVGYYNSVRHELLLVCTRGSCLPDVPKLLDSVVTIERAKHSEKPERFYDIIEQLYPHGKRLELFQRKPRNGWDGYGNEC